MSIIRKPSAWIPLVMSAAALALVLAYVALYGIPHGGDENAAAHLWQLLMAGQLPIIGWFVIRWWADNRRGVTLVAGIQLAAALAAAAPVAILGL